MTDKQEVYETALRNILFECHRRKMLKDPPPPEEWWRSMMDDPKELVWLVETVGDIAYDALKSGENSDPR